MASTEEQTVKITVYWLEKSRSQRILFLLEELKLKYEIQTFKRTSEMLAPEELKKIHPLGKSPVIKIEPTPASPTQFEPIILAESAPIVEYVSGYFGKHLIPTRYPAGQEDQIGCETAQWRRYSHLMHYAEGSIMPFLVMTLMVEQIKVARGAPFFVRPITRTIGKRVEDAFLSRNLDLHFGFVEKLLATSPDGGEFFCGKELTGADVMLIYPLEAALGRTSLTKEKYPQINAWVERIQARPAYKAAIQRIKDETGEYDPNF